MNDNSLKLKIKKATRNNWKTILPELTGLPSKKFRNMHQPCPLCREGEDRYRFDDKKGAGTYFCNRCGAGDGLVFLQKRLKKSEDEVLTLLDDLLGISSGNSKIELNQYAYEPEIPDTRVIIPAPLHAKNAYLNHWKYGKPNRTWEYTDANGDICFYICRFDIGGGKKEVIPMTYCHYYDKRSKEMRYGWRWKGVTKSDNVRRPLYNLTELDKPENKDKWVLVVEGEKAADAGSDMIEEFVVVTWSGGTKSIHNTDWSPLSRRNVLIWNDHDSPGYSATIEIFRLLFEYNSNRKIKMLVSPDSKEEGWDIADGQAEGADVNKLKQYMVQQSFGALSCKIK